MSDVNVSTDTWALTFAILFVMFYGDPDLHDALMRLLMNSGCLP